MLGEESGVQLGHVPAGQEAVDAVHEGGVVAHLGRQRTEQMADALLVLHIDLEIAHQDDGSIGPDALLAARELAASSRIALRRRGFQPADCVVRPSWPGRIRAGSPGYAGLVSHDDDQGRRRWSLVSARPPRRNPARRPSPPRPPARHRQSPDWPSRRRAS